MGYHTHFDNTEVFATYANAPLTPVKRFRLARPIIENGQTTPRVAERFQVSPATASEWAFRRRAGRPLTDGSSRPLRSPNQTPWKLEHRIVSLRFTRQWGPHRIGYHLNIPRSTVERVLARSRMPRLSWLDQATGLPVRRPKPVRYKHPPHPGDLVHVDLKEQGRIPNGGGNRKNGRPMGRKPKGHSGGRGYSYFHHAVQGTTAKRVITDNGPCFRSSAFKQALGESIAHKFTRPYRPQTDGKVERFNRTLAQEWAYAETCLSDETRAAT